MWPNQAQAWQLVSIVDRGLATISAEDCETAVR
jgi:hypothetical protein